MKALLGIFMLIVAFSTNAENVRLINNLISRGNRAYNLSQRTLIKECADSAMKLLSIGKLQENDSIDLLASILKLYGNYHYENSDFDNAALYYDKAKKVMDQHPEVSYRSLTKLLLWRDKAQLYYRLENYSGALELMALADDEIEYQTPYKPGSDDWLITKITYAMCLARMKRFDEAIRIAETELTNAIDKSSLSYARAERMYAKILMLGDADRTGSLNAYKRFFYRQKQAAAVNLGKMNKRQREEYWQTLRPFIADCYRLEKEDPAFLYDVTLFCKGLLLQLDRFSGNGVASVQALKTLSFQWEDIQKRLKTKQCAIEFIEYEKDGSARMAALVLNPTGQPSFVAMPTPGEILSSIGKELQTTDRASKDKLYEDEKLHALIWNDYLMNELKGARRVYFAPDGYLHRLAIEYFPPVENLEMYRLSSTRRLMDTPGRLDSSAATLFVGGVNYDLDKSPGDVANNDVNAYTNYIGKSFPKLSEASNEAKSIYNSRGNRADTLLVSSKASENSFKNIAPNYESILVSTHGDFCSSATTTTDIKPSEEDGTMSQNIMAFAGVNSYLRDKMFNPFNHYDGLLSAKEISEIDLSKCKLFTISACQSALGYISADGVFGLQRGLKNAGVEAMLLSLWNVNSDATFFLMKSFYGNLSGGMGIRKAFASARKELMKEQKGEEDSELVYVFDPATMSSMPVKKQITRSFNAPQYYNAFILIDALD